jgi:hypothetical protein
VTKKTFKRSRNDNDFEDEYPQKKLSKVKEEKQRKRERNYDNDLRSKNIDKLMEYDDE